MHGVFYYKSMQKMTTEYSNVLKYFKTAHTQRKFSFLVAPFCKIGYDNSDQAQAKSSTTSGLTDRLQQQLKRGEDVCQPRKADQYKTIYVNGDVRESLDTKTNR